MVKKGNIELSAQEVTAYWWINVIRYKVREILIYKSHDKSENKFAEIFYYYTEIEWRNLYLELVKYITESVNNYVPRGNGYGIDTYSQDTSEKGHDDINIALSKIIKRKIPDIRLASNSSKDSVVYTNIFGASVWYKSCGVNNLSTKYEPSYVLTGDKKELDFYNLLIATIATIKEKNHNFDSIELLRERFCSEYNNFNTKDNVDDINEMFNSAIDKAIDKGLVSIQHNQKYYSWFHEIDYIGLEKHMKEAEHYANVILSQIADENKNSHSKKLAQ